MGKSNAVLGKVPSWIGFGIVWGVQFNLFGSDNLFWLASSQRSSNDAFSVTMMLSVLLISFLVAFIARRVKKELRLSLSATISTIVGILVISVLPTLAIDPFLSMVAGGILCGYGFAILTISWYRAYAYMKGDSIPRTVAAAFLVGSVVMMGLSLVPHVPAVIITIVLLAFAAVQLSAFDRIESPDIRSATMSFDVAKRKALPVLYSLLALILLYVAVAQLLYLGDRSFSWYNMYMSGVEILSSVAVLALVWRGHLDDKLVELSALLIVATTLVAVPFLMTDLRMVSATTVSFCSHAVRVLSAIAFCLLVNRSRANAFSVFGTVEGVMKLPTLLGVTISLPLLRQENYYLTMVVLALVCIYAAVIALYAILRFTRKDNRSAEETIRRLSEQRDIDFEEFQDELFRKTCSRLAERFQLSGREEEVLELLIRKEPLSKISEKLCLSPNTIKTHTRSIYSKMEVHSKNDLTTVFNTTRKEVLLESGDLS